jgi:hypothetical protein
MMMFLVLMFVHNKVWRLLELYSSGTADARFVSFLGFDGQREEKSDEEVA